MLVDDGEIDVCDGFSDSDLPSSSVIMSPHFPENYPNDADCSLSLIAPQGEARK